MFVNLFKLDGGRMPQSDQHLTLLPAEKQARRHDLNFLF